MRWCPAQTPLARTAAAPAQRFGFIYVPHGSIMKDWTPVQEGAGFEFSPILKPLERFRDRLTVLTNLSNNGENGHSPSTAMWLSGTFPAKGSVIHLNTTVDQIIAQHLGQGTTFPSIELATEDHSSHLGSCAGDFLCSYMSTISWRTPTQPQPMEINPRVVFERMFGGDAATPQERRARLDRNNSLLDAVGESVADLQRGLGPRDRAKLTEYLDNVREIERRIQQAEKQRTETLLEVPATPIGVPESWEEHVKLMFELMALAYQGNLTRVVSFMMARELSTLSYPQIGVADGHHPVSHNNGVPEQVAKKAKIDSYHLALFAGFLERLRSTPDGDGNLLDHSTVRLRQRHEQRQPALARQPADSRRRRRRRAPERRSPPEVQAEHAAVEPDDCGARQGGRADGEVRRQFRTNRAVGGSEIVRTSGAGLRVQEEI